MRPTIALVAMLLMAQAAARTQVRVVRSAEDRLAGIAMVDVVVEHRPSRATADDRCRIARHDLGRAAVAALASAGLRATSSDRSSSWFHTVYITTEATMAGGSCVTWVATALRTAVHAIPDAESHTAAGSWGSLLRGDLDLARDGALISSAPAAHQKELLAAMRVQLARIAQRIAAANMQEK